MKKLDQDLQDLRTQVSNMGSLTKNMVRRVAEALHGTDQDTVYESILTEEDRLDQMQLDLDREAIRLLTVYSPVASDLRFVLSVTRVAAELERVGDLSKNICGSLQLMLNKTNTQPIPPLRKMADAVYVMVQDAMDALLNSDSRLARKTIRQDDLIDAMYDQVLEDLLSDDVVQQGIEEKIDLASTMAQILLCRSLERIGDQATNICEEVVYMVKGDDIRHQG